MGNSEYGEMGKWENGDLPIELVEEDLERLPLDELRDAGPSKFIFLMAENKNK